MQNAILTSLDAVSSLVRGTPNSSTWFTSFPMCLTAQYAKTVIPLIPSNTIVCSLQCLVLHTVYCVHTTFIIFHLLSPTFLCWGCCVVQNDKMMIEVGTTPKIPSSWPDAAMIVPQLCQIWPMISWKESWESHGSVTLTMLRYAGMLSNWANSAIINPGAEAT